LLKIAMRRVAKNHYTKMKGNAIVMNLC